MLGLKDKGIPSFCQVTMGSGSPRAEHGITISSPDRTLNSTGSPGGKLGGSTRKKQNICSSMVRIWSNAKHE
jgi:hypothetical protein